MKPYDKLTIFRNSQRTRDLRRFRELVEAYFERAAHDMDGLPVDWDGALVARAHINRMLPRVIQVVHAARLGTSRVSVTNPGMTVGEPDVLHHIFSARHAGRAGQEILDVIDLALGVYESSRLTALGRTFNPLHYVGTILAFVARLPRRAFIALGFRPQTPPIQAEDVARLEAVASRLADAEDLIETRFAELRDRQGEQLAENARQVEELAERLDFAERVMAQQRRVASLEAPEKNDVVEPT